MADAKDASPPLEALQAAAMKIIAENPAFAVGAAEIRGNTYRVFQNAPASIGGLFAYGAANHGDKPFLYYQDETYSFNDMWSRACRFANGLAEKYGVKKGDRVAIAMRNFPEWLTAYMGVSAIGGVVIPLNAWWKTEELHYALGDCAAKLVVVDAKRCHYLQPVKEELGLTLILAREEADGADGRFEAILDGASSDAPPAVEIDPEDDFCIPYTSGSTGNPKGVILTHRSAVSAIMSWAFTAAILKEARGGVSAFGDDPGILLGVPLFHVTGSHSIFMLSWLVGRRVAMMYRWSAAEAADMIRRFALTNFVGVPSQSFELIEAAGPEGLPSLLDLGAGGAKRPADHVRQLKERFGHASSSSGYGLSETNALGCVISFSDYQERPDSTGRAVPPLTDIKIALDDGSDAPAGEVGEVWIRSPATFRGYLNLPEDTKRAITPDGWFRTGDLGRLDDENFLFIVDRLKELIIRGGENISCLEVENRAYEHPDIAEAAVFSVPDEVLGERVGLVALPRDGARVDGAALHSFMAQELAGYKVPERIWISPQPLPRLASAKFDKRTIRKIALTQPPAHRADG